MLDKNIARYLENPSHSFMELNDEEFFLDGKVYSTKEANQMFQDKVSEINLNQGGFYLKDYGSVEEAGNQMRKQAGLSVTWEFGKTLLPIKDNNKEGGNDTMDMENKTEEVKELEALVAQLTEKVAQLERGNISMDQLAEQMAQMQYNSAHPIATHVREVAEMGGNAIKWCNDRIRELEAKADELKDKIVELGHNTKEAAIEGGEAVLGAVQQSYQNALDRIETAKNAVKEFRDNIIEKVKELCHKPVELFKDGVSKFKEFIQNSMAKHNEALAKTHIFNAKGYEVTAERIENFGREMHEVGQHLKAAACALFGKSCMEKPYKQSKFMAKWCENLRDAAKGEYEMATKYEYKAAANHIKANIESDSRAFKDMDER